LNDHHQEDAMSLIPNRFLFRTAYACPRVAGMPLDGDELLDLPESARLDNFAALDHQKNFADVRLAWNEFGLGVQAVVKGKDRPPLGDRDRPRGSDGLTLWLDTRGDRTGHRATRHCHQFHFLAAGGGQQRDEPAFVQTKINRALQDAPLATAIDVPFRCRPVCGGYRIEAFLPAAVLSGFDPDEHPRLGVYYAVRDFELGEQVLSVGAEFPFAEDPSLWATLELVR
jgi:hypothetical protein